MITRVTHRVPKDATREDLLAAIQVWEDGGGLTGHYVLALWRYWKHEGPDLSASGMRDYENVRRLLEDHA